MTEYYKRLESCCGQLPRYEYVHGLVYLVCEKCGRKTDLFYSKERANEDWIENHKS